MRTSIVEVAETSVAVVRDKVPFAGMAEAQRRARRALAAAGVASERALTVWFPPKDGIIDYAPGAFVADGFVAAAPVSVLTLPAGRAAHLVLHGAYDGLPGAWQTLFADCAALGVTPAGVNWEVYAPDGAATPETDLYALLA